MKETAVYAVRVHQLQSEGNARPSTSSLSRLIATEFEIPSSQFVTCWIVPGDVNREMRKKGFRRVLSPYSLQFP